MAKRNECPVTRLLELFYEENHELFWGVSRGRTAKVGDKAGCISSKGYLHTRVDGRNYRNHRILWAMRNGAWPTKDLDHIDRNKLNNSAGNLREVTNQQNGQNRSAQSDNKLGIKGVYLRPNGKYRAYIRHDDKLIHLGTHTTALAALQARADGELKYWGHVSQDTAANLLRLTLESTTPNQGTTK